VDAGKVKLGRADALKLARAAERVIATRGAKIFTFDMKKDRPSDGELLAVLLGPTGNLRAPTIRLGRSLLVGFNAKSYQEALT